MRKSFFFLREQEKYFSPCFFHIRLFIADHHVRSCCIWSAGKGTVFGIQLSASFSASLWSGEKDEVFQRVTFLSVPRYAPRLQVLG